MSKRQFNDIHTEMKLHEVRFRLVPSQMNAFENRAGLIWKRLRFIPSNLLKVPDERGVYVFVVAAPRKGLPSHGYVMYGGKAGDGDHTLKKRFKDYLQYKKRPIRPRIYRFLNDFEEALYFFYATILDTTIDLESIEKSINDAMLPPMVRNDFSAAVRNAINSFET